MVLDQESNPLWRDEGLYFRLPVGYKNARLRKRRVRIRRDVCVQGGSEQPHLDTCKAFLQGLLRPNQSISLENVQT